MGSYAKRWVFTLNNYTAEEEAALSIQDDSVEYLVWGREVGESGTPHLQGFVIFRERKRIRGVKSVIGQRCHVELARGSNTQAADYCKKDGQFVELGDTDVLGHGGGQGKRSDWDAFKEWLKSRESNPSELDLAESWPSLYGRYRSSTLAFARLYERPPCLVSGDLREWQSELDQYVRGQPDDRGIKFVVDKRGNSGKSWLVRYWYSHRTDCQRLSVGKRDDLAYAVDVSKRVFIFDIPRGSMEYLQYGILEQLKDQMIFSPKYESVGKILPNPVHVIVFSNEDPDIERMTIDRYDFMHLNLDIY